jgi:hypothetical protein|uniref:Uncharacterized protein n=1 Tax=Microchloropsis salina TaxID=2511165 RepID=A0A023PLT9_9STRA|nr:hypothetical protein Nsk00013 [Microchloropsis salina]
MENIQSQLSNAKYKTLIKSKEILKTTINSIELEPTNNKIKRNPTFIKLTSKTKPFHRCKIYLSLVKQAMNKFPTFKYKKFNEIQNFLRYDNQTKLASKLKNQFYVNKIFIAKLNFVYLLKAKIKKLSYINENIKVKFLELKPFISNSYLQILLKFEKYLFFYIKLLKKSSTKLKFINFIQRKVEQLLSQLNKKTKYLKGILFKLVIKISDFKNSFNKKKFIDYLSRLGFILKVYFIPFIFLANQSLLPFIQEYEELMVSSFSCKIFEKLPLMTTLIRIFNPLINSYNKMVQFWVIIAYFLIFPTGYKSLKLSYKLGYNGSIAFIFLLVNYSLGLSQEIAITIFECLKLIKDILFSNYLVKHLSTVKYKEKEEYTNIFTNLVQRYELQIKQDYFNWLLFLNHFILSPLAFISLAVLVYNCVYYIIYNKNPKITLITKAALATIKNPQEEE